MRNDRTGRSNVFRRLKACSSLQWPILRPYLMSDPSMDVFTQRRPRQIVKLSRSIQQNHLLIDAVIGTLAKNNLLELQTSRIIKIQGQASHMRSKTIRTMMTRI